MAERKQRSGAAPLLGAEHERRGRSTAKSDSGWRTLGWFGLAILFVALVDLAMVWYPIRSGNPAWEFGAIDRSVATVPVLLVGLMGVLASSLHGGNRLIAGLVGALSVLLSLAVVLGLFVYWTDVPLALDRTPAAALTGIKKSMVRTTAFGLVLLVLSGASAVVLLRTAFTRTQTR